MEKLSVRVSADSTCDLGAELLEKYDSQVCENFLELEKRVGLKKFTT